MDILLTHGYFLDEDPHEQEVMRPYPPLGVLYLSSYLQEQGFDVGIHDSTFSGRDSLFQHLTVSPPPVVGISANLLTRRSALEIVAVCNGAGVKVVLGGPDPSNYPLEYLNHGADFVVLGEGEHTLVELLRSLLEERNTDKEDIQGIAFLREGLLVKTDPRPLIKDLDSLPPPDRESIDLQQYVDTWKAHHGQGAISLITSRGCPYTCTWCSHSVFGYSYRSRSPQNVASEVELILDRYNPDILWYADDVFTLNRKWFFSYAAELNRRGIHIPFETISREDRLDEEVIQTLSDMGCFRLWIGSESGSQRILDAMKRRTKVERVREMVRGLQKLGIQAGMFIMLGYEGENLEDIRETVRHVRKACPDTLLTTVAYPIKGTPYYEEVEDRIISQKPWALGSDRDFTVEGRSSGSFYGYANRWLVSEHRLERMKRSRRFFDLDFLKSWASSVYGRLGMVLTSGPLE